MSCRANPAYKAKIFNTSYQLPDELALSGISGTGLLALRRAFNRQTDIRGN
ncbi:Uncharacterised protein [Salmonella enterica subsp. enterica serovar Typhi]|nr:Uncharacterised protein [Salmonella enterica subsp. enterica serovar Typhi]CGY99924.1 Uncharacterised protein [Salmonella enterica subsp. enterica serovar Typhi]